VILPRDVVLFRLILYIPAGFMTVFLGIGWAILAPFFWVTVLILGRTPRPVFDATAAVVRYTMRAQVYIMMLTSAYPKWLFGDQALVSAGPGSLQVPPRHSSTRPLLLSTGGRALLIVIIVLGVLGDIGENISEARLRNWDPGTDYTPGQNQVAASLWLDHPQRQR
jgi:hypothetical protein